MKALSYITFYAVLGVVFFGLMDIISNVVGEHYSMKVGVLIVVILGCGGLAIWAGARARIRLAWSCAWFTAAIICLGVGVYYLPMVQRNWIKTTAIDTQICYEGIRNAYPTPKMASEKAWVLSNERNKRIAALRWEYEQKILKVLITNDMAVFHSE